MPVSRVHRLLLRAGSTLLLSLAAACHSSTGPRERLLTLEVVPTVVPCYTMFETVCLQAREHATAPWRAFYNRIEGFHHESGYQYVLRVAERQVPNPPADGSSVTYRLIAILAKVAVPASSS